MVKKNTTETAVINRQLIPTRELTINEMRGHRCVNDLSDGGGAGGDGPKPDENPSPVEDESKGKQQEVEEPQKPEETKEPKAPEEPKADEIPDWVKSEDRAWKRIQDLENDKSQKQRSNDYLRSELKDRDTKIADLEAKVQEFEDKQQAAEFGAKKQAVLDEYGLPAEFLEDLTGTDEDSWKKKAERFATLRGGEASKRKNIPGGGLPEGKGSDEDKIQAQRARLGRRF